MENITSSKLFNTRQGTILLGVIAAVIAAVALIVYLHNYRNSVNSKNAQQQVLVAKALIQKGTPGDVVGSTSLYETASLPKSQVKTGALRRPVDARGQGRAYGHLSQPADHGRRLRRRARGRDEFDRAEPAGRRDRARLGGGGRRATRSPAATSTSGSRSTA